MGRTGQDLSACQAGTANANQMIARTMNPTNQIMPMNVTASPPLIGGDVAPGKTTRGFLAFEVPEGRMPVAVLFQGEAFGGEVVTIPVP